MRNIPHTVHQTHYVGEGGTPVYLSLVFRGFLDKEAVSGALWSALSLGLSTLGLGRSAKGEAVTRHKETGVGTLGRYGVVHYR